MGENQINQDIGFLRLTEVLKMFPVSKSTWWAGVKIQRYPQPVKIGPRITAWRRSDINKLLLDPEGNNHFPE
jgi:prophage regulatory protein